VLAETWLAEVRAAGEVSLASTELAGRIVGNLAVLRAMSLAVADKLNRGENPEQEAALVKDLGTEFEQAMPDWIQTALERDAQVPSPALARTLAYVMQLAPSYSLRGGTRQILRGIIARSLGLR